MGTLTVAFLPIFNRELVTNKESAERLAGVVSTVSILFISILALISFIFAPYLVDLVAPGFGGEKRELTIMLTRILMLSPIIFTASTMSSIILQSHNRFFPTAVAPIFYNVGIITGAVVFYRFWGVAGLTFGVIAGAAAHAPW